MAQIIRPRTAAETSGLLHGLPPDIVRTVAEGEEYSVLTAACTTFLQRIEAGDLHGSTSVVILLSHLACFRCRDSGPCRGQ